MSMTAARLCVADGPGLQASINKEASAVPLVIRTCGKLTALAHHAAPLCAVGII
jgi:hypothetical protein